MKTKLALCSKNPEEIATSPRDKTWSTAADHVTSTHGRRGAGHGGRHGVNAEGVRFARCAPARRRAARAAESVECFLEPMSHVAAALLRHPKRRDRPSSRPLAFGSRFER